MRNQIFLAILSSVIGGVLGAVTEYELGQQLESRPALAAEIVPVDEDSPTESEGPEEEGPKVHLGSKGQVIEEDPPQRFDQGSVSRVRTVDDEGNPTTFDIIVLAQEFSWAYAEADRVVNPSGAEERFTDFLDAPGLQNYMRSAIDIVAVGTASCEGEVGKEVERAERRAQQLVIWVREALPPPPAGFRRGLLKLNMGKSRGDCSGVSPKETLPQRRVVLVAVVERAPELSTKSLEVLLEESFAQVDSLPFLRPEDYSIFDLVAVM